MSTITDKLWGIYRESRDAGLDVSLTVSICNGAETFVFESVPSNGVADMGNHGRRKHARGRGRGRRGGRAQRAARSAGAAQLAAAAPSYEASACTPGLAPAAAPHWPPPPPSHEASACTPGLAPAAPSYAAVARSPPSLLQSRTVKRAKRPSGALARAAADAVTPVAAVSSAESPVDYIGTAPRAAASSVANVVVAMPAAVESALAGEAVTAADVASPPATAAAGRAVAAAAVEHPRPLPPFTMELRRRAVSFSSPSPSPIIFSTPSPSTTPLSPLQQLDGLTSPDPNPSASSPAITPPDPTPNPHSPFSSKLTYNSISPLHTRCCTFCEEVLRARENMTVRWCIYCNKEVDGSNLIQQFCDGHSALLCSDCYNNKGFCLREYFYDEE